MPPQSETKFLAELLESARQLTHFYLEKSTEVDKMQRFDIGKYRTNSICWVAAHLAWGEDNLILKGVANQGTGIEWLKLFKLGAEYPSEQDLPPYDEVIAALNSIHKSSLKALLKLPDAGLDEKNHIGLNFSAGNNKRAVIRHCIRHESFHCGQIGMLLRMLGKKVI